MPGETNIRILTCLGMYELTTVLRTRPPVGEEVTVTHTAVAVERSKRPPADEDRVVTVAMCRRGPVDLTH